MAGPDTWSDRARPGKLQHHSARGTMPRNAGDFTRGSQLITHEFLMWFASARLPFMVWFITFLLVLSAALALRLQSQEVQMILMRIYAAGWGFMEFNPGKVINLTLPSGEVIPAPISMVASHPDVAIAWNRMMRAVWGSLFISLFLAVPLAIWFVDFSKRRGKSILEERHQRGAMLVDGAELAAVINAFFGLIVAWNAFSRWAVRCMAAAGCADLTITDVLLLHHINHRARNKKLADICFVLNYEDTHVVAYSLKKLVAAGLARADKQGKEVFYSPTPRGEAIVQQYRAVREECLVKSLDTELNAPIGELARLLRTMSGMYDQAARAATSL